MQHPPHQLRLRAAFKRCPLDSGNRSGRIGGAVPLDRGRRPRPPCRHAGQGAGGGRGRPPHMATTTTPT